jgi:hypothetical protein
MYNMSLPKQRTYSSLLAILLYSMIHAHAQDQTPAGVVPPASGDQKKAKNEVKEAQEPKEPEMFQFAGGTLSQFIEQLNKDFGVNVWERATIEVPRQTRIPKMRLSSLSQRRGLPGILTAYNSLAQNGFRAIGTWHWEGFNPGGLPEILTLTRPAGGDKEAIRVRAFSLKGFSEEDRKNIEQAISEATELLHELRRNSGMTEESVPGTLHFNKPTGLLLAIGPESFLGAAEEIVKEYRSQSERSPSTRSLESKGEKNDSKTR